MPRLVPSLILALAMPSAALAADGDAHTVVLTGEVASQYCNDYNNGSYYQLGEVGSDVSISLDVAASAPWYSWDYGYDYYYYYYGYGAGYTNSGDEYYGITGDIEIAAGANSGALSLTYADGGYMSVRDYGWVGAGSDSVYWSAYDYQAYGWYGYNYASLSLDGGDFVSPTRDLDTLRSSFSGGWLYVQTQPSENVYCYIQARIDTILNAGLEDADLDWAPDAEDECPGYDDRIDLDRDGAPDGCDPCPRDRHDDSDDDGVCDSADQCEAGDDSVDANENGVPDCVDARGDASLVLNGFVDGYCNDGTTTTQYAGEPVTVSFVVLAPGDADYTYDSWVDDYYYYYYYYGDNYHYAYDRYSSNLVARFDVAGRHASIVAGANAYYSNLYVQNYQYYGQPSDSVYFDGYGSESYANVQVWGGDFVSEGRSLDRVSANWQASYVSLWTMVDGNNCQFSGTLDAIGALSTDADGDGVSDEADECPGHDDGADADLDGTADGCDACPADLLGDRDSDGACDSADPCPDDIGDDSDADGSCDSADLCDGGDDFANADGDAMPDACDVCPDDDENDADQDGLCGNLDQCDGGDDAVDFDGDGTADFCDACPLDVGNDSDGDGACDSLDICPFDAPNDPDADGVCTSDDACRAGDDHADRDGDHVADACDACADDAQNDVDGDGTCGDLDDCPSVYNANQADADDDGVGDACEADTDGDTVIDDSDNCRMIRNADQLDADRDGVGNACEADTDADGVIDDQDRCGGTASGAVRDATGCSLAQIVPCVGTWKNHGAYVSAYTKAAGGFQSAGLLTEAEKSALTSAAAMTTCGK